MKITLLDAEKAARTIGINFTQEKFNAYDLMIGMEVELEHGSRDAQTNVTNDDLVTTAKIALAHLKEMPDYYRKLEIMERGTIEDRKNKRYENQSTFSTVIGYIIFAAFMLIIYWTAKLKYNYYVHDDPEILKYQKKSDQLW